MSMSDPISDMITRIRNGQRVNKSQVESPASKLRESVLAVLEQEGYIRGYEVLEDRPGMKKIRVELKYFNERPVIQEIKRVSKPGCRVYASVNNLPKVYNGLGMSVLSTSKGVMSDNDARNANIGGEVLCSVF